MSCKRLGDYIEEIDIRNQNLEVETLLGVSVSKEFIPSVANTVGTNMKRYKIIKKNQFACSTMQVRRDKKMPVAILKDYDEAIISQAYPVFQVKDENVLMPDYLMMWFSRKEFDRQATFWAIGGVRGSLEWDDFLNFELPILSIEKQQEIVNEYHTVVNRIKLNEQLNTKLEETAQALYKHWFVDFEFPNKNGKPYKSSGGEMVYNEVLDKDIPVGWEVKGLSEIAEYLNGAAMQKYSAENEKNYIPVLKIRELNQGYTDKNSDKAGVKNTPEKYLINNGDIIFSWSGTLLIDMWAGGVSALNQHLFKVSSNNKPKWFYYLSTKHYIDRFIRIAEGNKTSLGHIKREHLDNSFVAFNDLLIKEWNKKYKTFIEVLLENKKQNQTLKELANLLLARMGR